MRIVGVMSGTSLDGLDLALCHFSGDSGFSIEKAETIRYSSEWKEKLITAPSLPAEDLLVLNNTYGEYIGLQVKQFLEGTSATAIASHGHTVFHQPSRKLTFQIGAGASIAAVSGVPVICDFRSVDVALGGQGAPLVPIGDELLFGKYDGCLNLGGFANVSFRNSSGKRVAFDICPVNIVLNDLSQQIGLEYDPSGENASRGKVNEELLEKLNDLHFYRQHPPKSLGREWVQEFINPLISSFQLPVIDQLCTFTEHAAFQLAAATEGLGKVLVTGGGVFNSHLLHRMRALSKTEFIVPSDDVVNFKEALIFGFLGYLRLTGKFNAITTVTGASGDSSGGAVYDPAGTLAKNTGE